MLNIFLAVSGGGGGWKYLLKLIFPPQLVVTTLVSNVCAQRFDGQVSDYQSKEGVIPGGISTTYEGDVDTSKIFSGSFQAGQPLSGEGPINIAVRRTHQVSTVPVNVPETEFVPQVIEVDAGELPIILKFNSRSSRVQVTQAHTGGGGGQVEQTSSEDEPTRLQHSVVKPIIQEVHEIITPFRRVIQVCTICRFLAIDLELINLFENPPGNSSSHRRGSHCGEPRSTAQGETRGTEAEATAKSHGQARREQGHGHQGTRSEGQRWWWLTGG